MSLFSDTGEAPQILTQAGALWILNILNIREIIQLIKI